LVIILVKTILVIRLLTMATLPQVSLGGLSREKVKDKKPEFYALMHWQRPVYCLLLDKKAN